MTYNPNIIFIGVSSKISTKFCSIAVKSKPIPCKCISPCTVGTATLHWESQEVVGWDSGCGRRKDMCHNTAALLHPYTLCKTPYGHLPLHLQPRLPPPRHLWPPTESLLFPERRNSKLSVLITPVIWLRLCLFLCMSIWVLLCGKGFPHTVGAAPFALRGFFQLWIQTHQVICPGTGVTQNDFSSLLTNLTVVLMVCLVAVSILSYIRNIV